MKYRVALAIGGIATVLAVPAFADNIDDAIKARQSYYQLVKHNAGVLFGMAKGKIEYDADKASVHAANLDALAKMSVSSLWPAGSSKEDRPGKTRALPVIWSTFPAITEKADAFSKATATMAASAGEGLDALKGGIGTLGASCKGCHDDYRAKAF